MMGFEYNEPTSGYYKCEVLGVKGFYVKVVADSIAPCGIRLATVELRYPRFIHSELMTHRDFSRNAASSRAIPVSKMIQQVRDEPAEPLKFLANQAGMVGGAELSEEEQKYLFGQWRATAKHVAAVAGRMNAAHKEHVNRMLEPWLFMTTIVSSTKWNNFYHLRDSEFAQPEFHYLTKLLRFALSNSRANTLDANDWHLPYVMDFEKREYQKSLWPYISAARCARVSYMNQNGTRDAKDDIKMTRERLIPPGHWSALEHPAFALATQTPSGNFTGWQQFRKTFENEYVF